MLRQPRERPGPKSRGSRPTRSHARCREMGWGLSRGLQGPLQGLVVTGQTLPPQGGPGAPVHSSIARGCPPATRNTWNLEAARSCSSGPRALLGPGRVGGPAGGLRAPPAASGHPLAARLPRAAPSPLDTTAPHGHPRARSPAAGAPRPAPSSQMTCGSQTGGL